MIKNRAVHHYGTIPQEADSFFEKFSENMWTGRHD